MISLKEQEAIIRGAKPLQDPLRAIFNEVRESAMSEEEAKQMDITNSVWHSFETSIASKEPINFQVRGNPSTGKSTVCAKLVYGINEMLGATPSFLENMHRVIFSDQIEFLRFTKSGQTNLGIQIDEWNRMVQTGYNATTEMTLFDYYSDVFAQRFVHRGSCAPSQVVDRNCYLFLDVEGRDLERKVTHLKVTYRDIITGESMVIGHMKVFVGDIIKLNFYELYRNKKFKRMELLEKNGVKDVRDLEFAYISLKVFSTLCEMAKSMKVKLNTVNKTVDMIRRQEGRVYSMLTMNEITGRCKGLLDLLTEKKEIERKLQKAKGNELKVSLAKALESIHEVFRIGLMDENRLAVMYNSYINMEPDRR